MNLKYCLYLIAGCLLCACSAHKSGRQVIDFTEDWRFTLSDSAANYAAGNVDDTAWRTLDLPHDWSVESDFSAEYPANAGGGALPGGIGWYRKTFSADKTWEGKQVSVDFDGIYWYSEVWLNGHSLGFRPNGYVSFSYDLTPWLKFGEENVLAVRVDNSRQPNSRWYSGSGIYRNVRLTVVNPVHIAQWGVSAYCDDNTLKSVQAHKGLTIEVKILNDSPENASLTVINELFSPEGKPVAKNSQNILVEAGRALPLQAGLTVENPQLWDVEHPNLYTLKTTVMQNGKKMDETTTTTGFRSFTFDPDKGFILNGKQVKINGVCNHHDLGCLGSAVNYRAIERQLQILKAMGCNGIRTSHNPPAPELLELCDKLGFIVMDEAFDMWEKQKTPYDYSHDFNEWYEKDLTSLILRDRNHPSVFMWSIGNEVPEQWDARGDSIARILSGIIRKLDTTRPIITACNEPSLLNPLFRPGVVDIVGLNYQLEHYEKVHEAFADRPFIGSETVSGLMSRGFYQMPADSIRIWANTPDILPGVSLSQCSAYDNCHVPWGNTHEESWKYIKKSDYVSGQYIWTGFDYLGEPTPFGWPARSSYFGVIDLAGFPKDVYYMYQSEWTNDDVLYIFPHWNWQAGETVDVWAYYNNAGEVELFLNGQSLGVRKKANDDLHVSWRVPFEPGTLKAVSRKDGKEILSREIKTAGDPVSIRLTADRNELRATGKDLSFVTVEVLDKDGNVVPTAGNFIQFSIEGNGSIVGTDSGDPTDHHSLKKPERKMFNGKALVAVQGKKASGTIRLKAVSDGLKEANITIFNK